MKTWLRLTLITLTVGGGFNGIVITFAAIGSPTLNGFAAIGILLVALAGYAFVIGSGLLLALDAQRTRPVKIALMLQIPWLSSPLLAYFFCAGLHMTPFVQVTDSFHLGINFYAGSGWTIALLHENPWGIGVNLAPVILLRLMKRQRASAEKSSRSATTEDAQQT